MMDLEDETDDSVGEITSPQIPLPRVSSAGHSLRQRAELKQPLRALENGDHQRTIKQKKRKKLKVSTRAKPTIPPAKRRLTERTEIRHQISQVTAVKRANFFIANKHLFLPLLPNSNYIQRLIEQRKGSPEHEKDISVPYQKIEKQPTG